MPVSRTQKEPFVFKEGDSWPPFAFDVKDEDGVKASLIGASILMQVKQKASDTDNLIEFTETNGFTISDDVATFDHKNAPRTLPAGIYVSDIQVTLANGIVKTVFECPITVKKDISR